MAFSVYQVVGVACQSRIKQTNYETDKRCEQLHIKRLKCRKEASARGVLRKTKSINCNVHVYDGEIIESFCGKKIVAMITLAGNLTLTFLWPKSVANAQEVFAAQTKLDEVPDLLRDQDWLPYDE